jgi:hypothetical protein
LFPLGKREKLYLLQVFEHVHLKKEDEEFTKKDMQRWLASKLTGSKPKLKHVSRVVDRLVTRNILTQTCIREFLPGLHSSKLALYKLTPCGLQLAKKLWLQEHTEKLVEEALTTLNKPVTTVNEIKTMIHQQLEQKYEGLFNRQDIEKTLTKDKIARIFRKQGLMPKKSKGRTLWIRPDREAWPLSGPSEGPVYPQAS